MQTVIALGNIADPSVIESLKTALYDKQDNIRWDAAVSLAKLGDNSGRDILLELMEGKIFVNFPEVNVQEQDQARIIAIRAGILLNDSVINKKIEELADKDGNIAIRKTAMEVLKTKNSSAESQIKTDIANG